MTPKNSVRINPDYKGLNDLPFRGDFSRTRELKVLQIQSY